MRNYLRACDKQGRDKKAGSGQGFFLRSRFFASVVDVADAWSCQLAVCISANASFR